MNATCYIVVVSVSRAPNVREVLINRWLEFQCTHYKNCFSVLMNPKYSNRLTVSGCSIHMTTWTNVDAVANNIP